MQELLAITPDRIREVYSGRPGCGCGCRGTYSEKPGRITRVLNEIKSKIGLDGWVVRFEDGIASAEGDRYFWAYLKSEGVAQ